MHLHQNQFQQIRLNKVLIIASLLFFLLPQTSCHNNLVKRYKTMDVQNVTSEAQIKLAAFVTEPETAQNDFLFLKFSPPAQAEVIKSTSMEDLLDFFTIKLDETKYSCNRVNVNTLQFTKRIIFSVWKDMANYYPADRLERLELTVENLKKGVKFTEWDKFDTKYGQKDLGKIQSTTSQEFSSQLAPRLHGILKDPGSVSTTFSKDQTEEVSIDYRYIQYSGLLSPNQLTLIQEGMNGMDLEGNASITLTFELDNDFLEYHDVIHFLSLFSNHAPINPDQVKIQNDKLLIPMCSFLNEIKDGINCSFYGNFIMRHVKNGDDTLIEGDDKVLFLKGQTKVLHSQIYLLTASEVSNLRNIFYLHLFADAGEELSIELPTNTDAPLDFATYEEAEEFAKWLFATQSCQIAGCKLKISENLLTREKLNMLRIGVRK